MTFWEYFWKIIFYGGLYLFAALSVAVAIGGFFNIRSLFKELGKNNRQHEPCEK